MLEDPRVVEQLPGDGVQVDIAGMLVPTELSARPFYDPDNRRLRS